MVRKWTNVGMGVMFLIMAFGYMFEYMNHGYITYRGYRTHGISAYVSIGLCLVISFMSLLATFRKYRSIKSLGYYPIDPENITINESFRRSFENFTLTYYSWKDMKMVERSIDYGYRGLYLAVDYDVGNEPEFLENLDQLFDKSDKHFNATIFFKEGWNVDYVDLPRIIKKVHKVIGVSNIDPIFNRWKSKAPERHNLTTKLNYGKHINRSAVFKFFRALFFILPPIALVLFINVFFSNELGFILHSKSKAANDAVASLLTIAVGSWELATAKYWSLSKGFSKEAVGIILKEEKLKLYLALFFIIFGTCKVFWVLAVM